MHRYLGRVIAGVAAIAAVAGAPLRASAQGVTGSAVTGTVTGEDGGPIDGAIVQLVNPATGGGYSATTVSGDNTSSTTSMPGDRTRGL